MKLRINKTEGIVTVELDVADTSEPLAMKLHSGQIAYLIQGLQTVLSNKAITLEIEL